MISYGQAGRSSIKASFKQIVHVDDHHETDGKHTSRNHKQFKLNNVLKEHHFHVVSNWRKVAYLIFFF